MNKLNIVSSFVSIIALVTLSGCGLQDGEVDSGPDAGGSTAGTGGSTAGTGGSTEGGASDGGATDGGATNPPAATNVDVFKTDGKCNFNFSQKYISGAPTGAMKLFNAPFDVAVWSVNMADDNKDGYIGFTWTGKGVIKPGTYRVSYVGYQGPASGPEAWGQYGAAEQIDAMSAKGKSFVDCNWYDAESKTIVDGTDCAVQFTVDAACNVTPAGNMGNFAQ